MANKTAAQLITAARKRPMAPEKLNALMLKVRKGATASLTFSNLVNIFDAIGWRIEPMMGWVPLHYMYDGRLWLVQKYARGSIETIKHDHERSKRAEAAMLPPKAKPGEHVIMEVSEIKEGANGFLFHQKEWVGAEGFTIRTADGKIVEYLPDHHSLGKPLDYGLYKLVDAIREARLRRCRERCAQHGGPLTRAAALARQHGDVRVLLGQLQARRWPARAPWLPAPRLG